MRVKQFIFFCLALILAGMPSKVLAQTTPPAFPTCLNPQGVIRASYDNGTHGIAGESAMRTGADVVYQLDDASLMQCFCDISGNGMQTNWWKVDTLDASQIRDFQNQGWIYEPQGTYWGLDNTAYLAKNTAYACKAPQIALIESGSASNSTSSGNSASNNTNTSSPTNTVKELANTGNILLVYVTCIVGLASLITGLLLRRQK